MYFVNADPIKIDINDLLEYLIELHFNNDYDKICKIMKIKYNPNYYKDDKIPYIYEKHNKMTFCNDENLPLHVRIYVDDETRNNLNVLLTASSNIINEKIMIDMIIKKWMDKVGVIGKLKTDKIIEVNESNETYIQLTVGKIIWDKFTVSCKNKNITTKKGFKIALFNYLYELRII